MKNAILSKGRLQKSTTNKEPPLKAGASGKGGQAPITRPNSPGEAKGRVLVDEKKPAGRNSTTSTFSAPRKEGSKDPAECGYTKP